MKKQSGITLVALIITIIVMVILAGVIIVSAVADGGIIDRAQKAMQQKERGEVEDLIIASYEYKTGASGGNVYAYLDLNATAGNIWDNLTNNGFTLTDGSGNKFNNKEDFLNYEDKLDGNEDNDIKSEIDINAKGDHGEYEGTVNENGLKGDGVTIKPENKNPEEDGDEIEEIDEDLEKLRSNLLPNQNLSIEDLGKAVTVQEVTITLGEELYFENDDMTEMINEITYNGKNYVIHMIGVSDGIAKIVGVDHIDETDIYYGEEYIYEFPTPDPADEEIIETYIIENDGTTKMNGVEVGSAKIFNGEFYMQVDGNIYSKLAKIHQNGRIIHVTAFGENKCLVRASAELEHEVLSYSIGEGTGTNKVFEDPVDGVIFFRNAEFGMKSTFYKEGFIFANNNIIANINKYGIVYGKDKNTSSSTYSTVGFVDPATKELKLLYNWEEYEAGEVISEFNLKYDEKYGLEIYNETDTIIDLIPGICQGNLAYLVLDNSTGYVCVNFNGTYILQKYLTNVVLDKEKSKLYIPELDLSNGNETGNFLECTISGNKIINKKNVEPSEFIHEQGIITGFSEYGKQQITNGKTEFQIPEKINGIVITEIGENALCGWDIEADKEIQLYQKITKITIPSTVKKVGERAFMLLSNLQTIIMEEREIDGKASGVEIFPYSAIFGSYALERIEVPSTITSFCEERYTFVDFKNVHIYINKTAEELDELIGEGWGDCDVIVYDKNGDVYKEY